MERKFILKVSNRPNLLSSSIFQPRTCFLPQVASWGRRIIIGVSGGILIFAPLAYGAVHPWAYFSIGLLTTLTSLTLLILLFYQIYANPHGALTIPYPPLWWVAIGLVIIVTIQIHSWPQSLVARLSPIALVIRTLGNGYGLAPLLPFSLNPYATLLEGLKLWPALIFFFILIYTVNRKGQLVGLAGLILTVALFETFYGFWYYRSHLVWGWKNLHNASAVSGTFINSNDLATFLVMAILLGYGLFLGLKPTPVAKRANPSDRERRRKWSSPEYAEPGRRRFLVLLLLLILVVGLISTNSRGGMLALICGFFLMTLLIMGRKKHKSHLFMIIFFILSAVIFGILLSSNSVPSRFRQIDYTRYLIYKAALVLFREFPWLGSGFGTFGDLFFRYQSGEMQEYYYLYTHSDWLQLLLESGLAGFVLVTAGWLIFLTSLVKQWYRRHNTLARGLGLGGISALGAGSFHALVDFPLHIPALALVFAGIAAITYLILFHRFSEDAAGSLPTVSVSSKYRKMAILAILGLIAFQLTMGAEVCYCWLAESAAPMEINSTRLTPRLGVEDFRRALTFNSRNSKYYLGLAEALDKSGTGERTLAQAQQSFQAAILYAPANWENHLKLAEFLLRHYEEAPSHRIPIALRELTAALTLCPYSAPLYARIASTLEWAEKYHPGAIPRELRGRQAYYRSRAIALDPSLATSFTAK
jgi:O-antigen ligase